MRTFVVTHNPRPIKVRVLGAYGLPKDERVVSRKAKYRLTLRIVKWSSMTTSCPRPPLPAERSRKPRNPFTEFQCIPNVLGPVTLDR
eukprot:14366425-Heterocapsa_arctica.AAC.1